MSGAFVAAWDYLEADHEVWGYVQNVEAGVIVLACSAPIATSVLAWELGGQQIP